MTKSVRASFGSRLYQKIVAPRQHDEQARSREKVCNIVIIGTGLFVACLFMLLLLSFSLLHNTYVLGRLLVCVGAFLYTAGIYKLSRAGRYRSAAYLLILFYAILATGSLWQWGINTPFGILIFGLVIVLSGTLLSARHALYASAFCGTVLLLLRLNVEYGWHVPPSSWQAVNSSLGDVIGYCVQFGMLAVVSWLFGREVERSLKRAHKAEAMLIMERALLEARVKKRTQELRDLQIEEMQQMYQFAELGQASTALLHDLANYLTVLTLEIQGLDKQHHADTINRTQHIVKHLDTMVDDVRKRAQGKSLETSFTIATKISEVVELMQYHAARHKVTLDWTVPKELQSIHYKGDPFHLAQAVTILIANAIDAYQGSNKPAAERHVLIRLEPAKDTYLLYVTDYGKGISRECRTHLFHPLTSSKKTGMGIGLYLAKQMVRTHFKGTLQLRPTMERTEFLITLPKKEPNA